MFPGRPPGASTFPGVTPAAHRGALTAPPPSLADLLGGSRVDTAVVQVLGGPWDGRVLAFESGTVTVQDSTDLRRRLSLNLVIEDDLAAVRAALDPRALVELRVAAGVADRPGVGARSWSWPLGVFSVVAPVFEDSGQGVRVSLECPDRTVRAKRSLMFDGYKVVAGSNASQVIATILQARCPWLERSFAATSATLPESIIGKPGADPWAECQEIAKSASCDLLIDASGVAILRRSQSAGTALPVAEWQVPARVMTQMQRSVDGAEMADGVIVQWGQEQRTIVPDEYRRGYRIYDGDASLITTEAQAREAGLAQLARTSGVVERVSGETLADPRLDVGQVVHLTSPDLGLARVAARLSSLTYHLGQPLMSFTVDDRAIAAGGVS